LTKYEQVTSAKVPIQNAVSANIMPPWMPSDVGQPLRFSRQMRSQDRALLLEWLANGTPVGDPKEPPRTDIPPAEVAPTPRADLHLDPGAPYVPKVGQDDDYHCFVMDPFASPGQAASDGNLYITNGMVIPGTKGIVHHSTVYSIPPSLTKIPRALDAAEPGPGYTCFGDALQGMGNQPGVEPVLGWEAPGGPWLLLPNDTAEKVPRGSLLVIQMHYSLLNYHGESDHTTAVLELAKQPPSKIAHTVALSDPPGLHIPAGAADAKQRFTVPVASIEATLALPCASKASCDLSIFGNFPHMHLLGKRVTTSVSGGPVLVDIPHWNFDWQGDYMFQTPVTVHRSDAIAVECHYNNTAANQPAAAAGRPLRDVSWGPGALDEMCLSYLFVIAGRPRAGLGLRLVANRRQSRVTT
jgi:hypothetical protein